MKFPRNARIFRGQLDAAPFAAVFFLMLMFLWLAALVYTPGVPLQLPIADGLPGTDKASVSVTIDAHGRLYYDNQPMLEPELRNRLRATAKNSLEPLTLVIIADKHVSYEMIIRLSMLARDAGIADALLATLPRMQPSSGLMFP